MTFLNLLITQFLITFFVYIKISKTSSAKDFQENKETLQNKSRERYQNIYNKENFKK